MPRKKVDNRIRVLVENGVALRQRSMFIIVGDRGRDQVSGGRGVGRCEGGGRYLESSSLYFQVVILHHMLSKAVVRARPSVLWCYKKELGFSRSVVML